MVLIFSEYPRPVPSFRAPVPAPDVEPTDAPLVSVCFNYEWLPYVLGALTQLTLQSTWAAFDEPPDALAMRRGASLIQQFALAYDDAACPVEEVPTPYWDESEDLDDELPADEQIWYGEVDDPEVAPSELTFRENAEIWTFAGLLAIAGAPGAALSFLTIAPKFVLAFKQNDLGKIIRVFVDADKAAQITDAGDGSVAEVAIAADPAFETHQIYVTVGSV